MQTTLAVTPRWAAAEFGGAELGDRRRCPRLIRVAAALGEDPNGTLPGSFSGWAEVKAAYRLVEGPEGAYDRGFVRPALVGAHRADRSQETPEAGEVVRGPRVAALGGGDRAGRSAARGGELDLSGRSGGGHLRDLHELPDAPPALHHPPQPNA